MRKYYELFDELAIPDRWHLGELLSVDDREPHLTAGVRYGGGPLRAVVSSGSVELDFCLTSFAVPVARSSVAAAIERLAGEDVERIALRIPGRTGFEALNVLRVVECLDERRSDFIKWTAHDHRADLAGQYRQVTNLRVSVESIPESAHIFRIGGWKIAIVVSEALKSEIERAGSHGATFTDVT